MTSLCKKLPLLNPGKWKPDDKSGRIFLGRLWLKKYRFANDNDVENNSVGFFK
jgi:hypothetical protein